MSASAQSLLSFIDASPSPYHGVNAARQAFVAAGFVELREEDSWQLEPGGAYMVARGGKTLLAFRVGQNPFVEAGGRIIAAHTDSPVLKIKPNPGFKARDADMLTAEIYGSPLLHSWLDRDLKLAGALYSKASGAQELCETVFELPDLRLRVNSLAPHLKTENRTTGVTVDMQKDLRLTFTQGEDDIRAALIDVLRSVLPKGQDEILSYDLCLADIQPSALVGQGDQFMSAPRLDNLFSTYCAVEALIGASKTSAATQIAVLYDAEEIGSGTWTGAESNLLEMLFQRLAIAFGGGAEDVYRAKARSVLVSADTAHSEHPSFLDATDKDHVPALNGGIAMKSSARANYAIGHSAEAWFNMICTDAGLPLQRFMYRCDHGGGSSVGPITTTALGVCGIDVGAPLLSMHSIREMAGAKDVAYSIEAFSCVYNSEASPTPS